MSYYRSRATTMARRGPTGRGNSERRTREILENAALFRLANPGVMEYLEKKAAEIATRGGSFDFPEKMIEAVGRFGGLTQGQMEAVHKMMARDEERRANPQPSHPEPLAVDLSRVSEAFKRALGLAGAEGEGVKFLRMRLGRFTFSPAGPNSRNPGAIYVKEEGTYLGKVVDGKFYRSRGCSDAQEQGIGEVAKDPEGAARTYGLRTGECSICGRELTNPESRARGIGPICAERFGWSGGATFRAEQVFEHDGFKFLVDELGNLSAAPGQHEAAYKDKHLLAAREAYADAHRRA